MSVLKDLRGLEQRVVARLQELKPLVEEYEELRRVAERLKIDVEPSRSQARPAQASGRSTRQRRSGQRRPAGRRRAGGTQATGRERRARVVALIGERPGVTVAELSAETGVDAPSLYRVVRKLVSEGVVRKDGKRLHIA